MFRTLSLAPLFWLVGCATDAVPVDDTAPPVEGRWSIEVGEIYESSCPAFHEELAIQPEIEALWVASSREGFMLSMNSGEFGWCSMTGESFDCRPTSEYAWDNAEQRLTSRMITQGNVIDGHTLDGAFELEFTCHGEDCGALGLSETPCRLAGEFTAFSEK